MKRKREMSPGLPGADYQVFLSFRGPDTRQGFTDCLYHFLVDAGVRVFRDNEDIRPGEKIDVILRAIDNSVVGIPIFSKDYASSKWCLRELAEMVERKKKILPVFYDVTPDDVKLKTSLYREALDRHENEKEKMQWEKALEEVAQISGWNKSDNQEEKALQEVVKIKGWELKHTGHAELCKCIVKEVLVNLKVKEKIVADHLVGMQEQVETMMNYLDVQAPGVRYVGIYGIGGTGKTTLAKTLFNQLSASFGASSFLADVRESSKHGGLRSLQERLIGDIQGRSIKNISDTDDGVKILRDVCKSKTTIIVLDDVDNSEQIECLAGRSSWFSSGSRIIVTTRDISVLSTQENLEGGGILMKHEMKEMDVGGALQLFSQHAFGREYPPENYLDISREIVNTIGCLPLALVIIGSHLHGKQKEVWEDNRSTLARIPQKNIKKTLMLSYDGLDFRTKQIFLDIACFPANLDKQNAFYMWESCGFHPEIGIKELVSLSLVKIIDGDKFFMHDHLKDLGRDIILMEGFVNVGARSRLWDHQEALCVLKGNQGSKKLEVLPLSQNISVPGCVTEESFRNLLSLRFLRMDSLTLMGDFQYKLSNLRWLSWHSCPTDFKAANLNLRRLVILDLSYGNFPDGWNGWNEIKVGEDLKVLDLSCCRMNRIPDLSEYKKLERLILQESTITEIDPSIGKLNRLKHLNLKLCRNLQGLPEEIGSAGAIEEIFLDQTGQSSKKFRSLPKFRAGKIAWIPDSIGRLHKLKSLSLRGCRIERLPNTFGGLKKLETLSLNDCSEIKQLPDSFCYLSSLSSLDIGFSGLIELPHSIGNLEKLKVLIMSRSRVRQLPSSIWKLKNLEEFDAKGCCLEGEIPAELGLLSNLKKLVLSDTKICRLPPSISHLTSLHTLWLESCNELEEVPTLPTSLVSFKFSSTALYKFPDLSVLKNLQDLELKNTSHPELSYDTNLSLWMLPTNVRIDSLLYPSIRGKYLKLYISGIPIIPLGIHTNASFFSQLVSLEVGCKNLIWLPQLPSSLSRLILRYIKPYTILTSLSNLTKLSHLTLYECSIGRDGFISLAIGDLPQLVTLNVLSDYSKLDGLSLPGSLECLCFYKSKYVKELPDLSHMKSLRFLVIKDYEELSYVLGTGRLVSLQELFITSCGSLRWLGFHLPKSLRKLHISYCACLDMLPDFSRLRYLEVLELEQCAVLTEIRGLGGATLLEQLTVSECASLDNLGPELPGNLKNLQLFHCPSLKLLDLSCLKDLFYLVISSCPAIVKITGFEKMEALQSLLITFCESLIEIGSKFPDGLRTIRITSCESLRKIPNVSHLKNLGMLTVDSHIAVPGIEQLTWTAISHDLS